jgi:septal ring factor EnvC (AmiA/AmiB activator)
MLVKQLGEEAGNAWLRSEEKKLLTERSDTSDRRIVGLQAEIAHARERLSLLENDKDTLQAALDRTQAESSRLFRQLAESASALSDSRSRLRQMEAGLAAAESERTEAMRTAEAKLLEVIIARGEAEEKVEHLAVVNSGWEQQTKKLELEVVALTERCKILSQTLTANESSLTHAN